MPRALLYQVGSNVPYSINSAGTPAFVACSFKASSFFRRFSTVYSEDFIVF